MLVEFNSYTISRRFDKTMDADSKPQVISSPLFSSRGSWPEAEMKKFVIGIEAGARGMWVEAAK